MILRLTFPFASFFRQKEVQFILAVSFVLTLFIYLNIWTEPRYRLIAHTPRYKIQASFPPESSTARIIRLERRDTVKAAMNHTWTGYKQNAWLHDELRPLSGVPKTSFGGWGATLVDALDTLYIMGMMSEFEDALISLSTTDFSRPSVDQIAVFEVTIRYLGGLLASQQYLNMYRDAFASFSKNLFFRPQLPSDPDILFPGSLNQWANGDGPPPLDGDVTHLACFVGGMVALGAKINNSSEEFEIARKLTDGCVWAYKNSPSGIMPERFHLFNCPDREKCTKAGEGSAFDSVIDPSYQLRPEAIESVFIMYRLTADTSTNFAYAKLRNVLTPNPTQEDQMESFWLAETLKYFFLLFSEPELVSLDEFVLNTEAHPLKQWGM
ncbi:related to class I alpha mannosidase [Phialocephala subalpina]|uniref:alpha-1,2-Mannosidase n=1 Tax=Phialocephala subalpina TaxID=576137 RepID=A0A1L7WYF7_9HELO|nr:related to class I alpha mannosidase [Phialocephala subalpina]